MTEVAANRLQEHRAGATAGSGPVRLCGRLERTLRL